MIVDANILLYARDSESRHHARAKEWLEGALNGSVRIGLPWESLSAFLRISTHPRTVSDPLTSSTAFDQVRSWIAAPAAWIPVPTDHHAEVLGELISDHEPTGNLLPDAHLASLAICHGVAVISADSDFARFDQLNWINPLT